MRIPVALAGLVVLGIGILLIGRDAAVTRQIVMAAMTGLCGLAAVLCFRRASEIPAERRGWLLIGTARAAIGVAGMMALAFPKVPDSVPRGLGFAFVDNILTVTALWIWPWRLDRATRQLPHALGSALFIGSLVLLLSISGTWTAGLRADALTRELLIAYGTHVALVGGVALYLVSQAPSRVDGPLGWILLGAVSGGFVLALLQAFASGSVVWGPLFAVLTVGPIGTILAAWCRIEVEPPPCMKLSPRWSLLLYAPYAVAGLALGWAHVVARPGLAGPTLGYLGLTAILLERQFVLLEELTESHHTLEARVRQRTRDLETMQTAVIRTEKMNLSATLGAGLAHDLNNALTVVLAAASALEERFDRGEPEAEAAADVRTAAQQACALTGRLMQFARQAREEAPGRIDLGETALQIESLLRVFVGQNIDLSMDLEPNSTTVVSTRARFEQILVNLVSNARDVLPDGGRIVVSVHHIDSGGVELSVEDNGPGVNEDVRAHLFEPFFTTKPEGHGTGLGLVSVKAMAEQDGGSVSVESRPGAGTVFHVSWPRAPHATP
jgi:signal transduction histidine kinase